jgi:hypothetical protein
MASPQIVINNFARTTITLDQLVAPNRTGGGDQNLDALQDADDKSFGAYRPIVFINGYYVEKYLRYFELDLNGFIPVVRFTFDMLNPTFISINYPKDGDIVSVYIRSWISTYKPIRMDFNILSVKSTPSNNSEGENITFTILGEARIPGLYSEVSKAYRMSTSYETLFDVSQELGLGFSSNDSGLVDKMTWICPNLSYYDFIRDVTSRSYKDDRSFFHCWIDPYYNLSFVNLNNQLTASDYEQNVRFIQGMGNGSIDDTSFTKTELTELESPLIFTNLNGYGDVPFFISGYTLISNSGNITNNYGYIQEVQFYDNSVVTENYKEKYIKYTLETVTSENVSENLVLQKGRAKEKEYQLEIRKNWYGTLNPLPNGAVHENFIQALVQNDFNSADLTKFTLQITVQGYFAGAYKGQAVPVSIYANKQGLRKSNTGVNNNQNTQQDINPVMDMFLSGIYIIMGMQIKYDPVVGFYQVYNLSKREWTLNSAGDFPKYFPINLVQG